jgi:hypothetical protein
LQSGVVNVSIVFAQPQRHKGMLDLLPTLAFLPRHRKLFPCHTFSGFGGLAPAHAITVTFAARALHVS